LVCGQALTGLSMEADGVSTFSASPIPTGCGGLSRDTPYTAKHGLFLASAPSGCTAKVVIDFVNAGSVIDAFVFGPAAPSCLQDGRLLQQPLRVPGEHGDQLDHGRGPRERRAESREVRRRAAVRLPLSRTPAPRP
jgi:hypothetical protein